MEFYFPMRSKNSKTDQSLDSLSSGDEPEFNHHEISLYAIKILKQFVALKESMDFSSLQIAFASVYLARSHFKHSKENSKLLSKAYQYEFALYESCVKIMNKSLDLDDMEVFERKEKLSMEIFRKSSKAKTTGSMANLKSTKQESPNQPETNLLNKTTSKININTNLIYSVKSINSTNSHNTSNDSTKK